MRMLQVVLAVLLLFLAYLMAAGAITRLVQIRRSFRSSTAVDITQALAIERNWGGAVNTLADSFVVATGGVILWILSSGQS
jgi:hypothetical protein